MASDPFDELLDPTAAALAPKEASADERIARSRRIARENDRLTRAGEVSDGTGKPAYRRLRRSAPWIAIGAAVGVVIIVLVLIAR